MTASRGHATYSGVGSSVGRMRVLITGGAGFIGSRGADELAERGHELVLLDNLLPQAHGSTPASQPDLIVGDVHDAGTVAKALEGVDVVCHQAAMVGHGLDPSDAP